MSLQKHRKSSARQRGEPDMGKNQELAGHNANYETLKAAVKCMIEEARGTCFPSNIKRISLACMVYHIWGARNKRIF